MGLRHGFSAPPDPPIDAVCPADTEIEHAHGLPAGARAAAAFAPARIHPAVTGQIADEQWRSAVAADLANS
ncbi:hypothetical protein [Streptomyces sp. NPDC058755]|uniref:hypothetical protein n=1 Tax=Streptomyces sp. NPDC058755 TaxID=3346624 RepID=UPI0036760FB1